MARFSTESVSAIAAILAAIFAGYSGWEAREQRVTTHQDAVESLRQTQRAYVGIQVTESQDKQYWIVEAKAVGATPAIDTHIEANINFVADDEATGLTIQELIDANKRKEKLGGGLVDNALLLPGMSKQLFTEKIEPVNFKPHKVVVTFGTITYKDVFGEKHTTNYCLRLGSFCAVGNDTN